MAEFSTKLGIKYEEAQLEGKPKKRLLNIADIDALEPFHWGYHFDKVFKNGGFDAIIANPPWEVFQTNEKEFFQKYSPSIQKKKLRIEDWESQKKEILKDPDIQENWLKYSSSFPHQWLYFKKSEQYSNQTTIIDGKAVGNKPNLCNLFLEQCFNLLRLKGECGIVIPSGIYTDLGTKQLREMLFSQTQITGLFCFENRKEIFEGVHRSFKFVVLSFEKGGNTQTFPARFMRHEVKELSNFPNSSDIELNVNLIRRLSPDSLSIMEFKSTIDVKIAEKMAKFPLLSNTNNGWGLELYGEELNMTRSSGYFKTDATDYPVYEGGMIWHFNSHYAESRYWIEEQELNESFKIKRTKRIDGLKKVPKDLINDYEVYRIAIRKIARNTDTRTLISTIIPRHSFVGNSLSVNFPFIHENLRYNELRFSANELLFISSLLNSFVIDYSLRYRINTNLNLFYLYQLPVPRLQKGDKWFSEIVERAAKLICTTPEFDELAKEVGLGSHINGVTNEAERGKLRAELDGIIAHVYGLSEKEFAYILTSFPVVAEIVKQDAINAYHKFMNQVN